MSEAMQTTVERLDRPSAYYLGRVGDSLTSTILSTRLTLYLYLLEQEA